MVAFFQCLHCWVGLVPRLATCTANGKVPHQKPGVMVGHLHSTAKRLVQGFLLEKRKAGRTHRREYITASLLGSKYVSQQVKISDKKEQRFGDIVTLFSSSNAKR